MNKIIFFKKTYLILQSFVLIVLIEANAMAQIIDDNLKYYCEGSLCACPIEKGLDYKDWGFWASGENKCENVMTSYLKDKSIDNFSLGGTPDKNGCLKINTGQWVDEMTGRLIINPDLAVVAHYISPKYLLDNKLDATLTDMDKVRITNSNSNLMVVDAVLERARIGKGLASWVPNNQKAKCTYVKKWSAVKNQFNLTIKQEDLTVLNALLDKCKDK